MEGSGWKGPDDLVETPSCNELARLMRRVRQIHESEVSRRRAGEAERAGGVLLFQEPPRRVIVVGDLHGDKATLRRILAKSWTLLDKALIVFLGDYVDRGTPEGQASVLAAVLRLKLAAPERVILLRGNHEPPPGLEPSPHDFPIALIRLCPDKAGELYEEARLLFDTMPHAALVRGWALLVHGGVPTSTIEGEDELQILGGADDNREALVEILWNDPSDAVEWRSPNYHRGIGYLWGPRVTAEAMQRLGVKFIIRGHEATLKGYKLNHKVNGNFRVVTLFSRVGPPYGSASAAFLCCPERPGESNTLGCVRVLSA